MSSPFFQEINQKLFTNTSHLWFILKSIRFGDSAKVYLELLGEEVIGTVEKVATGSYISYPIYNCIKII